MFLRLLPSARGSHFRVVVVMGAAVLGESEWQAPLVLAVTWGCHSLPPQRVATHALAAESLALGEATARTCVTLASGSSASAAHPRPEHVDRVARSASRQQPPCCHSGGFRRGASCRPAPQPRGAGVGAIPRALLCARGPSSARPWGGGVLAPAALPHCARPPSRGRWPRVRHSWASGRLRFLSLPLGPFAGPACNHEGGDAE